MDKLEEKIDLLVKSNERIQADVEDTKNLILRHTEMQAVFEKKLDIMENKINKNDNKDRQKNIILFKLEDVDENNTELLDRINKIFRDVGILLPEICILDSFKLGKREENKSRPICIKLLAERWKYVIFEKAAELRKLGYGVDNDYTKKDRAIKNKLLKARFLLRKQGKEPSLRGLSLYLDNKLLNEEDLDYIIETYIQTEDRNGDINTQSYTRLLTSSNKMQQSNKKKSGSQSQSKLNKYAHPQALTGVTTRNTNKIK